MRSFLQLSAFAASAFCLWSSSAVGADELPVKVTYDDHVKPIFREHCLSCHNANDKKSGLALDTYVATMEGGSGGESLVAGDLESSRLWALTAHVEQPKMPPNQDRIAEDKLAVIKKWIEQGMPENGGSTAMAPKVDLSQMGEVSLTRPSGPPPMPISLLKQPTLVTERAAAIAAIAASPWAPLVAVGGQEQVILYHSQSGQLLGILPFPEGEPQSITFSRDGKLILVGGGRHSHSGYAVLYEIETGKRITRVGDELDIVMAADISEDNSKIALAGPQRMVRVYDTASGALLHDLKKHTDWIYALRFSPDGLLIASADRSNGLVVWEADTGRLYVDLIGHKGEIRSLAWRPDSLALISSSLDGTIKLWDMNAGKLIKSWDAHAGGVFAVAACNDGTIASTGKDKKVKLWKANGDAAGELPALPDAGLEVAVTVDGLEVVAGDWQGNVRLWERANPKNEKSLQANPMRLEQRYAMGQLQVAPLQQAVAKENEQVGALGRQVADAVTTLKAHEAAFAKAQKSVAEAKKRIQLAQSAVQQVQKELEAAMGQLESQHEKLDQLTSEQVVLQLKSKDDASKSESIASVTKQVEQLENVIRDLRKQRTQAKHEVAVQEAKLGQLAKQLVASEAQLANGQKAVKEIEAQYAAAVEVQKSATETLAAHQSQLDLLQADIASFDAARKQWTERLAAIQAEVRKHEQQNIADQSAIESQTESQKSVDAKLSSLKSELEKIQAAIVQLEKQRATDAQTMAEKQSAIEGRLSELAKLQSEQAALMLHVDAYRN